MPCNILIELLPIERPIGGRGRGGEGWPDWGGAQEGGQVGRLVGWNVPVGRNVYAARKEVCMCRVKRVLGRV